MRIRVRICLRVTKKFDPEFDTHLTSISLPKFQRRGLPGKARPPRTQWGGVPVPHSNVRSRVSGPDISFVHHPTPWQSLRETSGFLLRSRFGVDRLRQVEAESVAELKARNFSTSLS